LITSSRITDTDMSTHTRSMYMWVCLWNVRLLLGIIFGRKV